MYRWSYALLHVGISLALCGCSGETKTPPDAGLVKNPDPTNEPGNADSKDYKKGVAPDDPSVVYDEPFTMNTGFKIYNGKAYDRASLWIDPKTKLVLPDKSTEVVRSDEANAVVIYMEKRMHHGFHGHKPNWPITYGRPGMGCAVKLEKGNLVIGTFGEFYYKEGADNIRLVVHVPGKVEVIRKAGLVGRPGGTDGSDRHPELINPAPGEPKPALTKRKEGRPETWLAPTVEDGWHEIPAVPDRERRAEKQ
jgi:hypothetical protein